MISLPAAEDDILITVQYDATGLASATMMDSVLLGWLVPEAYAVAASNTLRDRPPGKGQPQASVRTPPVPVIVGNIAADRSGNQPDHLAAMGCSLVEPPRMPQQRRPLE